MQYSEQIINRAKALKFKVIEADSQGKHLVQVHGQKMGDITLFYDVKEADEVYIENVSYQTFINDPFVGVIDYYCELINNKPFEVINRVGLKELDFFIRGQTSVPSFKFYSGELYELLTLGEKIYKSLNKKESQMVRFSILNMRDISFSEQIEYFEEFLSAYIYPRFSGIELDLVEFEKKDLFISFISNTSDDEQRRLVSKIIREELDLSANGVTLKF